MKRLLNFGYWDGDVELCWELQGIGWDGVRCMPPLTPLAVTPPAGSVIITGDANAIPSYPPNISIEVGNEPNGGGGGGIGLMSPSAYAALCRACIAQAMPRQIPVWIGALETVQATGGLTAALSYLSEVLGLIGDVPFGVTWHRYPDTTTVTDPLAGYPTREAEVQALLRVVGNRPWAVSEFAPPTYYETRRWWFWTQRHWYTDVQVASFDAYEYAFWARMGASWVARYAINEDPLMRGIRTAQSVWKACAHLNALPTLYGS